MCGICGIVARRGGPVDGDLVGRMADTLSHRGPDDSGVYTGDGVGLGHRRLSVIDLSPRACQPMANEDGRLRIVCNGVTSSAPEATPRSSCTSTRRRGAPASTT
jgi:asparagine synthase (glutamine-hydrolysing)